eukprot:TRINITY_DN2855_c0_g1_i2.p1 TRINITY_DN2855_c0_g1~~TRINITY_DN2855_c0_g1_i2.p1  ORF type:complete len:544 (-),score=185.34 TRINITY_DN2855_c0_g1_i2:46-1512(-)
MWDHIVRYTTSSIHICNRDESFDWMVEWLSNHPEIQKSQNLSISVKKKAHEYDPTARDDGAKDSLPTLMMIPREGSYFLRHEKRLMWVTYSKRDINSTSSGYRSQPARLQAEDIELRILGSDRKFLEDIVRGAMKAYYVKMASKVAIYVPESWMDAWKITTFRTPRTLESVILAEGIADRIITDVQRFSKSEDWYNQHGIPYRRGYLLHGPPGTGKTSFLLALAGHLRKPICMLSLSAPELNDTNLNSLLTSAPMGSIILIEDVDSAFTEKRDKNDDDSNRVTFSGLLNCLDGITSQEGNLIFMTTNHIERLNEALIRPGRVDMKLHIDRASTDQLRRMFGYFFPKHTDSVAEDEFVKRVPEKKYSTAEIQGLFLQHRDDPLELIDNMEEYFTTLNHHRILIEEELAKEKARKEAKDDDDDKDKKDKEDKDKEDKDKEDKVKEDKVKEDKEKEEKEVKKEKEEKEGEEKDKIQETKEISDQTVDTKAA